MAKKITITLSDKAENQFRGYSVEQILEKGWAKYSNK
jgi:hypothetical protein